MRWTNGAERIFGFSGEEAIGNNLWSLISLPGQADTDREIGRKLDDSGSCDNEMLRKKKDGGLILTPPASRFRTTRAKFSTSSPASGIGPS